MVAGRSGISEENLERVREAFLQCSGKSDRTSSTVACYNFHTALHAKFANITLVRNSYFMN